MAGIIGQIIGGVANVGSSLIQRGTTKKANRQQNKARRLEATTAYERNLEQWNRENQYNSPTAQMERLKEAGLNPAMMYGQSNPGTTAANSPQYQAPQISHDVPPPINTANMVSDYQNVELKQAQTNNVKAATQSIKQETLNKAMNEMLMGIRGQSDRLNLGKDMAVYDTQIEFQKEKTRGQRLAADNLKTKGLNIASQTTLNALKAAYQGFLNNMAADNIFPGDSLFARQFQKQFKGARFNPKNWKMQGKKWDFGTKAYGRQFNK